MTGGGNRLEGTAWWSKGFAVAPARTGRRRAGGPDAAGPTCWEPVVLASVVAVVLPLVRTRAAEGFGEGSRAIGSAGLLTGLLASDLMVLQVVMMARNPVGGRAWGHDPARPPPPLGPASPRFWLMLAHVARSSRR